MNGQYTGVLVLVQHCTIGGKCEVGQFRLLARKREGVSVVCCCRCCWLRGMG